MGLSGLVAAGANESLEAILKQALLKEIESRASAHEQWQQRNTETQQAEQARQFEAQQAGEEADRGLRNRQLEATLSRQAQQDEIAAAGRRQEANNRGILDMAASGLEQGTVNPRDPEGKKTLAAMLMRAGDQSGLDLLTQPTDEEQDTRALKRYESQKQIDRKYDRPTQAPAPPRDPIADYRARKEIDAQYDSAKPANTDEALDTAREAKRIAGALRVHPGLNGAFGVLDARTPTLRQSTADAEVLRDALTSLLTLENTGKLKGVLSNADMQILKQASTTIAAPMSEGAARAELARLEKVMERAETALSGGQVPAPTGGGKTIRYDAKGNRIP